MAKLVKRQVVFLTAEQSKEVKRLSELPEYQYNDQPSEAAVMRRALDVFLSQLSAAMDDSHKHPAA